MKLYSCKASAPPRYLRPTKTNTRFVSYAEGIAFIKKNKAQSIEILRKKFRMDANQESYLEKTYTRYANLYLDKVPYVSIQGVKTLLEYMEDQNPKARTADPQSFVDNRIVRLLESGGFFAKLYE
jgi:hypothetical protein